MKRNFLRMMLAVVLLACSLLCSCGETSDGKSPATPDSMDPGIHSAPAADDTTIPSIYINTQNGVAIPDTKEEVNCTVNLVSEFKQQCAQNLIATVRTRGNGSMYVGKKTGKFPYKLKFDEKINLFGTGDGKEKDWILLANVGDHTMLRDFAAKYMGDLLDGITYSPNVKPVNVYLNDRYIGVYTLTEQVEVKDSRVDINDSLKGEVNGFLVELDAYAGKTETENAFLVGENHFSVKSDVFSEKQFSYIQNYIEQVNNAIYNGEKETLEQLVDINSLVDMYLLQEYVKNTDAGFSSFYMYKDVSGKMYFSPPWDFDLGFGNDKRLDNGSYQGLYVGEGRDNFVQNSKWYMQLMNQEWFYNLAAERWKTVSHEIVPQVIATVRETAKKISPMMEYNYNRWDFMGKFIHQEPDSIVALTTYEQHVDYLIDWMENRKSWLDSEFQKSYAPRVASQTAPSA